MSEQGGPVPDTGMATGSEDGAPGELVDDAPLRPDEEAVLAQLRRADGPAAAVVEDSPEAERAVQDESVLPIASADRAAPDPRRPEFRAP